MKYLKVILWDAEIGRLAFDEKTRRTFFTFNPEAKGGIPDVSPLLIKGNRTSNPLPVYGDERPMYQGLPPFITDSLPDSWGNAVFEQWVKQNKLPRNRVSPFYKLIFIGKRGMGALEYEPSSIDFSNDINIDINSLYGLSQLILQEKEDLKLSNAQELTMNALLSVGTSAGGRQTKAILAINHNTGEIRSGQVDSLPGYEHFILKFGDSTWPLSQIEIAYYDMATEVGIEMMPCSLMQVDGVDHFLTKRFDRKNGEKIHMQTLAVINPEASSYEDLFETCRELALSETEIYQLYLRLVFNVMANNTDDHNKNFAFLLPKGGKWSLSPAYDMTFIFNAFGTGPNIDRRLSVGGKTSGITKSDLLDFGKEHGVKDAHGAIDKVANALKNFGKYAQLRGVSQPCRAIIQRFIDDILLSFDYSIEKSILTDDFIDGLGREISDFNISINSKGYFEISAIVDGKRRRRFIRQNMPDYEKLIKTDVFHLTNEVKKDLTERLLTDQ